MSGGLGRRTVAGARDRADWRIPPLNTLKPAAMSRSSQLWMGVLRVYLVLAGGLMLARIVTLAIVA